MSVYRPQLGTELGQGRSMESRTCISDLVGVLTTWPGPQLPINWCESCLCPLSCPTLAADNSIYCMFQQQNSLLVAYLDCSAPSLCLMLALAFQFPTSCVCVVAEPMYYECNNALVNNNSDCCNALQFMT